MKFERNRNSKKYFLCGLILVVVLTVTVTFIVSKANYRMTASIPLTEGKVVSSPYDINIVSLYLDNVEQDSDTIIPSGYKINEDASYCYKGANKSSRDSNAKLYTDELGNHSFSGISKSSKCILYLEKAVASNYHNMQDLLDNYYIYKRVRTSKNKDFNVPFSEDTKKTVFIASDNDGISYYFAGNPLDNWVEFGGYYWRIIRVNGDGSIRLIYQGRTEDESGKELESQISGEETQIGISAFNLSNGDNKYVGYFYEQDQSHGTKESSTIYTYLNNWFENESGLKSKQYFNKIDTNAGFCGDRVSYLTGINGASISSSGVGTTETYYGAYVRLRPGGIEPTATSLAISPILSCSNNNDLYTYSDASRGNKVLANPVGLISADEASYAGIVANYSVNINPNYLNTNQNYWAISPYWYIKAGAMFFVNKYGGFNYDSGNISEKYGIRPVINLRSDVTFTGDGTQANPFKVV
ncbi:MAG: hypothetical protein NC483_04900, partial [Ruminococcus sp.]|nr:hypothetical protein [Ruminococcus sp.]